MRRKISLATLVLVAMLTLSLPAAVGLGSAQSLTTIDEDNPLADPSAGETYDNESTAGGDVPGYDMRITAAESHEDAGLEGIEYTSASDTMRHYLRVQYNESIERTIRFYVHESVWHPHGGEEQWERIDHADLADSNESVAIGTNESEPTIQYDAANGSDEHWLSVPSCDSTLGDDAEVCTDERPDDPDHIYVIADGDDPPPVRYKYGTDLSTRITTSINELRAVPDRIMDSIDGIFGGS